MLSSQAEELFGVSLMTTNRLKEVVFIPNIITLILVFLARNRTDRKSESPRYAAVFWSAARSGAPRHFTSVSRDLPKRCRRCALPPQSRMPPVVAAQAARGLPVFVRVDL